MVLLKLAACFHHAGMLFEKGECGVKKYPVLLLVLTSKEGLSPFEAPGLDEQGESRISL